MKRKLEIIALWWMAALLLVVSAQILTVPTFSAGNTAAVAAQPEVLGAVTTKARGSSPVEAVLHAKPNNNIDLKGLSAAAFLVYDAETGDVLVSQNASEKYPIASLTKLMTALVTYNNNDLTGFATVTPKDLISVSPSLNFEVGDALQLQDLFNAMLVGSNNDAAEALANHAVAGGVANFLKHMNQTAAVLSMQNTKFSNPLGFDSRDNYSTAEDLQKLVQETQKLSAFTNLGRRTAYSFTSLSGNTYKTKATNKLIGTHEEIEAVKSGSTPNSKQSLISKATRDNHTVVIIVLGSNDREKDTLSLENLVFNNFTWQ